MAPPVRFPRPALARLAALLAGPALAACATEPAQAGWIELEQVRPRTRVGVFLNEPLTLHFSAPVDQASVTRGSVRIRAAGEDVPARGKFEVEEAMVRFLPELPTRPDLLDAGFQPGTLYVVEVRGFPYLDGLRALDGRPLVATYRWSFETAAASDGDARAQLFDDRTPGWSPPLLPRSLSIQADEPILLECDEPIDPRTLDAGGFLLRPVGAPAPVPLEIRLLTNSDAGARPGGERTVLELRPRALLEPRPHLLSQERGGLRDFGGSPVVLHGDRGGPDLRLEVVPAGPRELHLESFLGTEGRSPVPVPGVDGTAWWSGEGLVTVRLPAAAGDGRAGRVELGGELGEGDLAAVSIRVPEGQVATLTAPGLVVLRAQGSLVVEGRLERPGLPGGGAPGGGEPAPRPGETLSEWLERAGELGTPWTVLIAGGDLMVRGELEVSGPLLLVAGGMLRVPATGRVGSTGGRVHLLGEGGGPGLPATAGRVALAIDEPEKNPLREPLTFAVLSGPIPATGGVERWVDSLVAAEARGGEVEVLFVPDDAPLEAPIESWDTRSHARALGGASRLRLLVLLAVRPPPADAGPLPWRPPVVDNVVLFFERSEAP